MPSAVEAGRAVLQFNTYVKLYLIKERVAEMTVFIKFSPAFRCLDQN